MDADMIYAAGRLAETLSRKGLTISCAESCTGGLIGYCVTSLPGSSQYFMGSAVTYSNRAKEDLLGVSEGILIQYGAVSAQTARQMAMGARNAYHSDISVAVTGIAGPGGSTADKPVGLVYIAVCDGKDPKAERFVFGGDRDSVRKQTAIRAMEMLIECAEGAD